MSDKVMYSGMEPGDLAIRHYNNCSQLKVVLLTQAEIQEIFDKGGWDEFYSQYPDSQGTLVLSRVGFNPAVDQSLVYAGNQSHYLACRLPEPPSVAARRPCT